MKLAIYFLLLSAIPNPDSGDMQAQSAGTVIGTVTDAVTRDPIRGAVVSADGGSISTTADGGSTATTADDGSFAIHDVQPGDAHLRVACDGYRRTEGAVQVMPGGVQRQNWELHPMARLTVRLADADSGNPLGLPVLLRPLTLYATGGATRPTGTPGETAFINLEPGDYLVEVHSLDGAPDFEKPPGAAPTAPRKAYGVVWYPGVTEMNMAGAFHLEEGERRSVDLRIPPRRTFDAEGALEIPLGRERDPVAIRIEDYRARTVKVSSAVPRDTFYIGKLLPGKYAIDAIVGQPADWEYGRTEFEITDRGITDLKLCFRPMAILFGTIRMAEDDVPLPSDLLVQVRPDDAESTRLPPFEGSHPTLTVEGGRFQATGLIPTDYGAVLKNLPPGYAVADVLYGNASPGDLPFHLEGTGQLNFVITSKAGAISGVIDSDEKPMPKHALLLVPDSFSARSGMLRIVEVESDAQGAFAFRSLAPGKYRLILLKDQRLNPSAIAEQMAAGQTVEVGPSATTVVTVHPN